MSVIGKVVKGIFGGGDEPAMEPAPAPVAPGIDENVEAEKERQELALQKRRRAAGESTIRAGGLLALKRREERRAAKTLGVSDG